MSGDPVSNANGHAGGEIVLSTKAERALSDWTPVSSHLCTVLLDGSLRIRNNRPKHRDLSVVCMWPAIATCSISLGPVLSRLERALGGISAVADDFNSQIRHLLEIKAHGKAICCPA